MKPLYADYPTQAEFNRSAREAVNALIDRQNLFGSRTVTASFTANNDYQLYLIDATTGNVTATLPPAAAYKNKTFMFKRIDASGNSVTLARSSTNTIDGATSQSMASQYDFYAVHSNGSNWYLLS